MSGPAPTLRSLARALGLSRTTVSDALRGSPRVDPNTAARVKKVANVDEQGDRANVRQNTPPKGLRNKR